MCTALDADRFGVKTFRDLAQRADFYLALEPSRAGAKHLRAVQQAVRNALLAIEHGDAAAAAVCAAQALHHAWRAEIAEAWTEIAAGMKAVRSGDEANAKRTAKAERERAEWQRQAEEIWAKNSRLSANDVAKKIDESRAGYVRKFIQRPSE